MDDQPRAVFPAPASRIEPSAHRGSVSLAVHEDLLASEGLASAGTSQPGQEQESAASRSILADAVSHEMRSTLALISGYSQSLLHLSLDDTTQREYLNRISQAAESLTELADEVLDLAIVDDRQVLRRQPVSLGWLAERLATELAREGDGVLIEREIPEHLPLVHADPVWIAHVLRNLISNALRHGANGARRVRIEGREDDDWIVMTVSDDGAGIDPDERNRVFDAYFRGRRALESGAEGSGLGLYVCRQLVEAHDGEIWLNDVQRGASVSFSVPRYPASERGATAALPRSVASVAAGEPRGGAWRPPEGGPETRHGTDHGMLRPALGAAGPARAAG